jgi:hypothetical protein
MMDRVVTIPASYLNTTIFIGNHRKKQNNLLGATGKRCLRPHNWDSPIERKFLIMGLVEMFKKT